MSNKPRKHHYVPQAYMRPFAEVDNQLFVVNKEFGSIREASTKSVAYLKDYYTIDTVDEDDSAEAEEGLGKIESKCIPLLVRLAEGDGTFTNPEFADMAIYIAIQYGRTPFTRQRMDEMAVKIANVELKKEAIKIANDPQEYDKFIKDMTTRTPDARVPTREEIAKTADFSSILSEVSFNNGAYVASLFRTSWDIADGLLKTRWVVFHAPKGAAFITSDNPVGLIINRQLKEYEVPAILLPGAIRCFPLNSKSCLVMLDGGFRKEIEHKVISKNEVRKINQMTYAQAQKYVISGSKALLTSLTPPRSS